MTYTGTGIILLINALLEYVEGPFEYKIFTYFSESGNNVCSSMFFQCMSYLGNLRKMTKLVTLGLMH